MALTVNHKEMLADMNGLMCDLMHQRATIPREELEYIAEKLATMKDERLKNAVAGLIGWGDEERAKLETFIAVSLRLMEKTNPSKLKECVKWVEIHFHMKHINDRTKEAENGRA